MNKESLSASISVPEGVKIANTVLMPGDPKRAEYLAEKYLDNPVRFNSVRNMSGFTGFWKGRLISVMGSGMGIPSFAIYASELYSEFEVETIIRIGSAGGLSPDVAPRDLIIAMGASTDSSFEDAWNMPGKLAAVADYDLLSSCVRISRDMGLSAAVGRVYTSDRFCYPLGGVNEKLRDMGHLGIDMETAGLYWLAAAFNKKALSILTVSNHLITGEGLTSLEREQSFDAMILLALDTAISQQSSTEVNMLNQICAIAREAGKIILDASPEKQVEKKSSRHDLVTYYDKFIQDYIQIRLKSLCFEASFQGEEGINSSSGNGMRFIVDPIDGTANFIRGMNRSCVSIALYDGELGEIGVVYNPYLNELFCAQRGQGAALNGKPIHASDVKIEDALVEFGTSPYQPSLYDLTFRIARAAMDLCMDVRRAGSAALDICDVAAGRGDIFFECSLAPWDFAAGAIIAREAGCMVCNMRGEPLNTESKSSVFVSNKYCFSPFLALLEQLPDI